MIVFNKQHIPEGQTSLCQPVYQKYRIYKTFNTTSDDAVIQTADDAK